MRLFHYTLFLFISLFLSCESADYTEEEKDKLREAQKIHNEAMATFAEAKMMMAELTKVRSEIRRKAGLETGNSAATQDTTSQASDTATARPGNQAQQTARQAAGSDTSSAARTAPADTSKLDQDTKRVLEKLNQAQADLMTWMRDIYTVPGLNEGSEGEKTKDPALGMDYDSRRLTKDIEFKEFPQNSSVDHILNKQQEMKENIDRIYEDMKKSVAEAKKSVM